MKIEYKITVWMKYLKYLNTQKKICNIKKCLHKVSRIMGNISFKQLPLFMLNYHLNSSGKKTKLPISKINQKCTNQYQATLEINFKNSGVV